MGVITVTRSVASLGDELAGALAERLRYRLIGRAELLNLVGPSNFAASPELAERPPTFWERLDLERRRSRGQLRRAVVPLAAAGDVVLVGLGAGQVLRGLGQVLRLDVVAPLDARVERLRAGNGQTADQARAELRRHDREAAAYIRYMFGIDWADPLQWDLVFNTGRLTVEQGVALVAGLVEAGGLTPSEEDAQRLRDLELRGRVEAALLDAPDLWVEDLRVAAEAGRVRLAGVVADDEDRQRAGEMAAAVSGVVDVENAVQLHALLASGRLDEF